MRESDAAWLVADIGGTNLRFAIASPGVDGRPALRQVRSLSAAAFNSLVHATRSYLQGLDVEVQGAVVSVAGRVIDGAVRMTNLPWTINAIELAHALSLHCVEIVNDLAAAAAALPVLRADEAQLLWSSDPLRPRAGTRRCAIIGAGTGLGIAGAMIEGMRVRVLDTEGGHAAYAPQTAQEEAIAQALGIRFGRVSWERVVSGPGLANIYRALAGTGPDDATPTPELIVASAQDGTDVRGSLAVGLFSQAPAAVAGDCVLMQGAWDGVYLMGELLQVTRPWLDHPAFRSRFTDKGPFADSMESVPVRLITHTQPVLMGAACIAMTKYERALSVAPAAEALI